MEDVIVITITAMETVVLVAVARVLISVITAQTSVDAEIHPISVVAECLQTSVAVT